MSDTDRIRVPTNGHRKAIDPEVVGPTTPPTTDPAIDEAATASPDLRIAVTPAQLVAGLGIVAGLVLIAFGSRRRGKRG
jgi:hypothetical protein